jgi:hypothetical protein
MTQASTRAKRGFVVPPSLTQPSTLFDDTHPDHTLGQLGNDTQWMRQHTANLKHLLHLALVHRRWGHARKLLTVLYQRDGRRIPEYVYKIGLAVLMDTSQRQPDGVACIRYFQLLLSLTLRAPSGATYVCFVRVGLRMMAV